MIPKPNKNSVRLLIGIIGGLAIGALALGIVYLHSQAEHPLGDSLITERGNQHFESNKWHYHAQISENWYIENTTADSLAIYPDYFPSSTSAANCKIALSAFTYDGRPRGEWITSRLSMDPTVNVKEISAEEIPHESGSGIKWKGVMDGASTTLLYLFNATSAYEIVPSSLGDGDCDDDADLFVDHFEI